ncbi:FtsX-like permease family protein [Salinibacterium sp. SYSU T00001]|uniref:FtsX-like permease family protein n=1 Tax=Homoserinimonas sedimenticola TaxID=2986805 RepID=UPI0022362B5D|nr:FtsX-like permease family protein [Salinibacterium sedimenticola]MCW4386803.1 FtsX-like permease family protein [Salinibacterium sedimenticola]
MTATTTTTGIPARPARSRRGAPIARLTWMLARPGADSLSTLLLPGVAFAVTTALLLTVAGGGAMFWRWPDEEWAATYQLLSGLALALLVIPLASLSGAAARLSARRRDDRLATLRLLGATGRAVVAITVLESALIASAGAVIGVVLYLAATPLVGLIPFGGAPIGAAAILLSPLWVAAIVVAIVLLAAVSAVVGLRKVVISPLGVRLKQSAPRVSWLRMLVGAVVVIVAFVTLQSFGVLPSYTAIAVAIAAAFAIGVGVLNLVGPWVIWLIARVQLSRAGTAQKLIAARTMLEAPKVAWRQVSGLAMTSFVAVVGGTGVSFLIKEGGPADQVVLFSDVRTGIIITLVASFLMVACSVGVNQASAVLDRRDLYVGLDRVGMPRGVLEAARARGIMVPLAWVSLGSAALGALLVFPLAGYALITAPASLLVIALAFAVGIALVSLALVATRPVVTRVLEHPERAQ